MLENSSSVKMETTAQANVLPVNFASRKVTLAEFMESKGFAPQQPIYDSHRPQRFNRQGIPKAPKTCFMFAFQNRRIDGSTYDVVVFGDWKRADPNDLKEKHTYHSEEFSGREKIEVNKQIKAAVELAKKTRMEDQEAAAIEAEKILAKANDCEHTPYMKLKKIDALYGCSISDLVLIVPLRDISGKLWTIQRIYQNKEKMFLEDGVVQGNFHVIGKPLQETDEAFLVEGFATGSSVHQASGKTVIVTFGKSNLSTVTKIIKEAYPKIALTIAGDSDWEKETNYGKEAAIKVSKRHEIPAVFPKFKDDDNGLTDFNDIHVKYGIEAVRMMIDPPKKGENAKKHSVGEINRDLADLIEGGSYTPELIKSMIGEFGLKFESVRGRKTETPRIIQIKDDGKNAEIVHVDYVADALRKFVRNFFGKLKKYNLALGRCKDVADEWSRVYTHRSELPKAVGFLSDDELCLHRLPFDPIRCSLEELQVHAPIFAEVLTRLSNSQGFCQRLGSIYDPKADKKQVCWIYGPKDGGKSVITELIKALTGPQYAILSRSSLRTEYWKASLVDKRVCLVAEAPLDFLRSDDFKYVTGDAEVDILQKYEVAYKAPMNTLFFLTSNPAPAIPNDDALKERIIACHLDKVPAKKKKGFEETCKALALEAAYIAGYCIGEYEKLASGESLTCDYSALDENIDTFDSRYLVFFDEWLSPGGQISALVLQDLMKNFGFRKGTHQKECKLAIQSRYPFTEKRDYLPEHMGGGRQTNLYGIQKRKF